MQLADAFNIFKVQSGGSAGMAAAPQKVEADLAALRLEHENTKAEVVQMQQ